MNILRFGTFWQENGVHRDLILDQRTQSAGVIRMQMGQDHCIRYETAGPEKAAERAVILSRIHDINLVLVPDDRGVRVPCTELNIFRTVMMCGKKRHDNQHSTKDQHTGTHSCMETDKAAKTEEKKDDTENGKEIRYVDPQRQAGQCSQLPDTGKQEARDRRKGDRQKR